MMATTGGSTLSQVWLTYVLTDLDVPKALTLCFSLKKVFTSRKLAVFVSPNVSPAMRELVRHAFDFLFYLEVGLNTAGLTNKEFVKVSAFNLKCFGKVAVLEPTVFAVKNSDDIFDNNQIASGVLATKSEQDDTQFIDDDLSIFVVKPCLQVFQTLMNSLNTKNGSGVHSEILAATKLSSNPVEMKYSGKLSTTRIAILRNESDISLVNIDIPMENEVPDDFGFCGKLILEQRKKIYDESVQPLLKTINFVRNWSTDFTGNISSRLESTFQHQPSKEEKEPIAIVGMSCRYPSANNLEEFWNLLLNGEDGTGNPPEFRWRPEQSARTVVDCKNINAGFLKVPVDEFDAKFFGISPKEMVFLDPQHRLLHELVWESLEDAAVNPKSLQGTNGSVFIGSWTNYYNDILVAGGSNEFYRTYMGNSIGAAAARISFLLGMTGPSIATESGCSSAMVAVHLACRALQNRETNFAFACGVNLLLDPFEMDDMPVVVSPDGLCKTFDANANGFARAEGCGVLVLKRFSDAVRNDDKIWGLIKGTAMTQEGVSKSLGTPTIHCESLAMTQALQDGGVDAAQVSYVEAHGTGTVVGDPMEVAAIAKAYHSKERKEPLMIGSVKTNVGHTESCSGITGIMKVVLGMQHQVIPPHRNFETLNPAIDLNAVPAKIPLNTEDWRKEVGKPRFAGVSSFGITGTDAHVIIEEPPTLFSEGLSSNLLQIERPLHIMKVTAKTKEALDTLLQNYKNHFNIGSANLIGFKDSAYTANIGRSDFSERAILIAKSYGEAAEIIKEEKFFRGEEASDEARGKICFLFTGQGSQYPGMAKELYKTSPVFRMHFEYCQNILKNQYNIDITQVMWLEEGNSKEEVSQTIFSQTSIFCVEYALVKLWESWGVKADYALGHSLGEFGAAVCANILSVEDALTLVTERSRLIDQLPHGKMLVIKADKQKVDSVMKGFAKDDPTKVLDVAALNSTQQTVVAGDSDGVLKFSECCKAVKLKCIMLEATHAFHSKHMDPMLNEYRVVTNKVLRNLGQSKLKGNCGYISGMLGTLIEASELSPEYWVQHTREKVSFLDASKKAVDLGCKTFIEIGPQPILCALTMINNDKLPSLLCLPSLKQNENEWETLLNTLAKLYVKGWEIDWKGVDQFYLRKKVTLPHYPFIGKTFWPVISSVTGSNIHPLLGAVISNASSAKLFQSGLSLGGALDYLKDHVIGEHIIFPGAGYLEICLAAGLATIEATTTGSLSPPNRPMKVENLVIEAPLRLTETTTCQIQTVAEFNCTNINGEDWNDIRIKIFRQNTSESSKAWHAHAKASFSPLPTSFDKQVVFDSHQFLETVKGSATGDITAVTQIYDKLALLGLKFGPAFKSIEKIWRDDENRTLIAKLKGPNYKHSGRQNPYIIHPVVLDGMIQAMMIFHSISSLKKSLCVPIKIGKFVWLSQAIISEYDELYVHAFHQEKNSLDASAILVDTFGNVLAIMSGVELINTTIKAIESLVEQQTTFYPDIWEEVWRKEPSLLEHAVDVELAKGKFYTEEFHQDFERKHNIPSKELCGVLKNLETFVYLNYLRALYELGWKPEVNQRFTQIALSKELGIQGEFRQYTSFLLLVFQEEGILEKEDELDERGDEIWTVLRMPPPNDKVIKMLEEPRLSSSLIQSFNTTLLFQKLGESMSQVLQGAISPISILFPQGSYTHPTMAQFYDEYAIFSKVNQVSVVVNKQLKHMADSQLKLDFQVRILEIGAGTGSYSGKLMNTLEQLGIRFEYTYTDISTSFFAAAEKRFEKYLKHIKFMKLNIEEDPLAQGLIPEYFDFVYCGEVVHATRDIKESLRNIRKVMKPYARLNLIETTRVSRLLTFLVGMLEGYWRFRDFELRPKYCVMEKNVWKQVLQSEGFQVDGIFSTTIDYHSSICAQKTMEIINSPVEPSKMWLLFHLPNNPISVFFISKLAQVPGRSIVVIETGSNFQTNVDNSQFVVRESEYEDFVSLFSSLKARKEDIEGIVYCWALNNSVTSQELLLQPYFNLTKNVFNLKKIPRLSLITSGIVPIEDNDLAGFNASTLWGYSKTMKNENSHFNCRCIEVADGNVDDLRLQELFYEVWNSDMQNQVAFAKNSRLVPKYTPHKPLNNALKLPNGTDRFQLILPETKSIDDLQFGSLGLNDLKGDEVEVQIKASALNFRDVFCVLKPSDEFKDSNAVGCDFAGVVKQVGENVTKWKVGDRVCGCNVNFTAMPSHLTLVEDLLFQLPAHLSYCEGATMPAVYITSFLCLVEIANITKDDVVLIHAASGGVGLSAIEICRDIGCKIIATAGSKRKQNFLRNLGIEHIFRSRNTEYGDQILELTKGRGVDVVLNSLTSEGFKEASLKSCALGARFIEMSKLNIWTKEEVKELRPDVAYTAVYLSESDTNEWIRYISSLKLLLRKGVAKPIPYLRFDAQNIREALKYMQKAKHIGKVVCVLPEIKMDRGLIKIHTPMFNDNSTYLITGGSGGIGFVVCKWMVEKGAKNVVLAARSPPKPSIQVVINEMNSTGANIISVQLDVGNREECRHLIQIKLEELGLPALKGIMHAAGTLSDGLIVNQDWEKLSSIFNPKISGTLNLHELTQHLNLEHFVLFSSSVALFGAPGQSNHAAANAFEDTFARYRNSLGLPATTINWGQWGEVGVATEVDVPGLKTLSNRQGLIGLEYVMKTQRIQASIINVSSFVLLSKVYPSLSFYADECIAKTASGGTKFSITLDEFWQQYDSLVELHERVILLKKTLGFIVYSVLRMDASDSINYDINFQDLGVDSLMFVEIKNLIQTLMGDRLVVSTSAIKESDTINFLGDTLVGLIEGDIEHDNTKPTHEQVNQLIREDCHLPDHIFAKDGQQAKLVGEVRTILLTGCTGTLGPYILRELTNRSQITEIFCLIRPSKTNSIKQRLITVLEGMGLLSQINMKKVTCISGNVAATKLGIDEKIYAELSGKVDAIFHCAACVIHTQHYKRIKSLSDMRAVNVGGTTKVLEFACDNTLKHVFHVSSIVTATMVDGGSGKFSERWPEVQDYDNVTTLGYPVSKFVGDVLAKQAVERGIPVKAFRLPLILGESDTGRCSIKFNHMILRYLFIMKTGIMPSIAMPLIALPVDTCTEASVQLFFNEKLPVGIYNISHRNPDTDQEFVNIAKRFGYHVDVVDFSEFAKRVRDSESGEGDSALPIFKDFYADDEEFTVSFANTPFLRKWIDGNNSDDFWMSTLVEECLPSFYEKQKSSMEYLYDSLRFCKKQGWFREFGLRCD